MKCRNLRVNPSRSLRVAIDDSRSLRVAIDDSRSLRVAVDEGRSLRVAIDDSRSLRVATDDGRGPHTADAQHPVRTADKNLLGASRSAALVSKKVSQMEACRIKSITSSRKA